MKIILRGRQAAPQAVPRSPVYSAPGYSPAVPYAGAAPAGMPYAEPNYPTYPPPDMPLGQNPVQPPPPNYPNPNYGYHQGGASPGHTGQPPMQQGGYQQPHSGYQQGYEAVDPQQYSAGYEMGQPQYSGALLPPPPALLHPLLLLLNPVYLSQLSACPNDTATYHGSQLKPKGTFFCSV